MNNDLTTTEAATLTEAELRRELRRADRLEATR